MAWTMAWNPSKDRLFNEACRKASEALIRWEDVLKPKEESKAMTQKEKVRKAIETTNGLEKEATRLGYDIQKNKSRDGFVREVVLSKRYSTRPRRQSSSEFHSGLAVCSVADEKFFDENIGDCIAFHKALCLRVPEWLIYAPEVKDERKYVWKFNPAKYIAHELKNHGGSATEDQTNAWVRNADVMKNYEIRTKPEHEDVFDKVEVKTEPLPTDATAKTKSGWGPENPCGDKRCGFCYPKK